MKYFDSIFSFLLTGVVYIIGGWDVAIQSLIIVILIDYITGMISAKVNKKLNSKVGFKGILKKSCYFLVIALATVCDNLTLQNGVIRTLVIYFLVANDGLSIIENLGKIGIKLPQKLTDTLEQLKEKEK